MTDEVRVRGTVTVQMYRQLPKEHRTTYVVGMADMLGFAFLYAGPQYVPRLDAMLEYLQGRDNALVRQRFDAYLEETSQRGDYMVASCFAAALRTWCMPDGQSLQRVGDVGSTGLWSWLYRAFANIREKVVDVCIGVAASLTVLVRTP